MKTNCLQLPEGGDFGAFHCSLAQKFDTCTNLDLTTSLPLVGKGYSA